jgi:putative ABC transport system permease protein
VGDLDQIDVVADPGQQSTAALEALMSALQDRLGDSVSVTYPATQGKRVSQMLNTYQTGLSFFSAIALFVGIFLIYNTFSMTVVERTRELGMLRTLGMTRSQVIRQILTEALVLGVAGVVIGVIVGFVLSQGLVLAMEVTLAQDLSNPQVTVPALLLSVGVGLVATVLAALIPAWRAGRVSPLEALRVRATSRDGWLVRAGWPVGSACIAFAYIMNYQPLFPGLRIQISQIAVFVMFVGATLLIPPTVSLWERVTRPIMVHLYGSEGRLGSSNVQRSKMRTALTVAALMVGVAMVIGIQAMTTAFEVDIEEWMDTYIGGDLFIYSTTPLRSHLARRLESVKGVEAVTPKRYFEAKWVTSDGDEEDISITGVDTQSFLRVTSFVLASSQDDQISLMTALAEGDSILITTVLAEKHDLAKGDLVRIRTRRGLRDFRVAGVVVDFYDHGHVLQMSWKDLRRYFGINDVSAFMIKVAPGHAPADVQQRLEDQYGERRHLAVQSNEVIRDAGLRVTEQTFALFDVLSLIAIVVAALGIVNTLTMNVLERTREIGMLRSIGMTRRQVAKMVLAESALMGVIGGAFGIVFGIFLSRLMVAFSAEVEGYQMTYILPVMGIVVGTAIALILSQIAAIWPAHRAANIRIISAIQFE